MQSKPNAEKPEVLVVGQTPPPFHGQAIMIKILADARFNSVDKHFIPAAFSSTMSEVGTFKFKKIAHLFFLIRSTLSFLRKNPRSMLVYFPAPAKIIPIIRDILYLTVVRRFVRKTIFVYHAAGSGAYLKKSGFFLRFFANLAYGHPSAAVRVSKNAPLDADQFNPALWFVVSNGINVPVLPRPVGSDRGKASLLFVGLHSRQKGVFCCLETVRILRDEGFDFRIQFVGEWADPEFEVECLNYVRENGLTGHVSFLGRLVGDEKWRVFSCSDFLIFPSLHHAESFGLVAAEAFAYGMPVVACKWRGLMDVVDDNINGYLVDDQNPAVFADKISTLLRDDTKRDLFSAEARKKYLGFFTEQIHLSNMEQLMIEVWNAPV